MRKLFTSGHHWPPLAPALLAQCNDALFISEYIEGWSNNKAIEIYNPTGISHRHDGLPPRALLQRRHSGAEDNQEVVLSAAPLRPTMCWCTFWTSKTLTA